MARRVPVLGYDRLWQALGQPIDDRRHGITVGDCQSTAWAKIVLYVDDDKEVAFSRFKSRAHGWAPILNVG